MHNNLEPPIFNPKNFMPFNMLVINRNENEIQIRFQHTNRFNFLMVEELNEAFPDLGKHSGNAFLFDFTGISFIDTTGFRYLFFLLQKGREHKFDYHICNLSDEVKELIGKIDMELPPEIFSVKEEESCS